jgi:type II secretion system protein H
MHIRPQHHQQRGGFTLVEIIIVVMLIGMIMAWGVPTFVQTFKRKPLQQTVNDLLEATAAARAAAILTGKPAELVFRTDRSFYVRSSAAAAADASTAGAAGRLDDSLELDMLNVNFINMKEQEVSEVPVKFFPNGTCEEFTITISEPGTRNMRMIRLDVITGHANLLTEEGIARLKK